MPLDLEQALVFPLISWLWDISLSGWVRCHHRSLVLVGAQFNLILLFALQALNLPTLKLHRIFTSATQILPHLPVLQLDPLSGHMPPAFSLVCWAHHFTMSQGLPRLVGHYFSLLEAPVSPGSPGFIVVKFCHAFPLVVSHSPSQIPNIRCIADLISKASAIQRNYF